MKPKSNIKKKKYLLVVPLDMWERFDAVNKSNFRKNNSALNMLIEEYLKRKKK